MRRGDEEDDVDLGLSALEWQCERIVAYGGQTENSEQSDDEEHRPQRHALPDVQKCGQRRAGLKQTRHCAHDPRL